MLAEGDIDKWFLNGHDNGSYPSLCLYSSSQVSATLRAHDYTKGL